MSYAGYLAQIPTVESTTWVYLSSLLILALFCKFNRIWSLRNFDLIGLILLAPGLWCSTWFEFAINQSTKKLRYVWLFSVTGLLLIRMLIDTALVRRPLLEPNLSLGGMIFLLVALMVFFTGTILTKGPSPDALVSSKSIAKPMNVYKAEIIEPMVIPPLPPPLNQQFKSKINLRPATIQQRPKLNPESIHQMLSNRLQPIRNLDDDKLSRLPNRSRTNKTKFAQRGQVFG